MQANAVAIERGWTWFANGWRLFARHILVWVLLGLMFLFVMFVSLLIPVIGQLVFVFISPVLAAGLWFAAREADENRQPRPTHLWEGFRDAGIRNRLFGLSLVALAGAVATAALMMILMRDGMAALMGQADTVVPVMGVDFWLRLLIVLIPQLLVALALLYAVPLVLFRGAAPGAALLSSLQASGRNLLPLFTFGLVYTAAAIVASIPFGLGWLVLLPASFPMLFCSYKDLYEPPAPGAGVV